MFLSRLNKVHIYIYVLSRVFKEPTHFSYSKEQGTEFPVLWFILVFIVGPSSQRTEFPLDRIVQGKMLCASLCLCLKFGVCKGVAQ